MNYATLNKPENLLVPKPLFIDNKEGFFVFSEDLTIKKCENFSSVISNIVEQFGLKGTEEKIVLEKKDYFEEEEYELEVEQNLIKISAKTDKGIFIAFQTIKQMYISNDKIIPCCHIKDKPKFPWRGVMIDCSRNFISVKELKKIIDLASLHHMNTFHWHFTDDQAWRFEIPELPLLTEIGAKRQNIHYEEPWLSHDYYSVADVQEIIKYASDRYMTVVPEIETPGHARALLTAYPEYGCTGGPYEVLPHWGIFNEVLCAGNEKLLPFIKKIIDYTASVFPGPYIHIGGDECPRVAWRDCPKCQKKMKELGLEKEDELQSYLTSEISKLVVESGKIPLGWDEVLEGTENIGLPGDLIVMSWQGVKGGIEASALGHKVIMCPNTDGCYFDYKHLDQKEEPGNIGVTTIKDVCSYSPISSKMTEKQQSMVLGGQCQIWTEKIEFSKYLEYMLFPRLSAFAEQLWNPCGFEDFESRKQVLIDRLRKLDINCYSGPSY